MSTTHSHSAIKLPFQHLDEIKDFNHTLASQGYTLADVILVPSLFRAKIDWQAVIQQGKFYLTEDGVQAYCNSNGLYLGTLSKNAPVQIEFHLVEMKGGVAHLIDCLHSLCDHYEMQRKSSKKAFTFEWNHTALQFKLRCHYDVVLKVIELLNEVGEQLP